MRRVLVVLLLAMPIASGAQNVLTFPMNIAPSIRNDFVGHASYTTAQGIDFAMPIGTNVLAAYDGTAYAHDNGMDNSGGTTGGYGNYLIIDHGIINGHTLETRCGHLSTGTFKVINGQRVERGRILAQSGNSGWSTGPHLHFEVRIDGVPVNPYDLKNWLWTTNPPSHAPEFAIGQFPPWGIAGLDAAHVVQKFRDAEDRFLGAYRRAGFTNVSMAAYDNDRKEEYEGRYVHWWVAPLPPKVQGPNYSVLLQDVKLQALRGDGANVFARAEALLIYNPDTDMVYIVKEGFWTLYMERNGVVTLRAPVGDEVLLSNKSIEQYFQGGWCFWDPDIGTLEAYDKDSKRPIPPYEVNYVTVGTGGDDTYVLTVASAGEDITRVASGSEAMGATGTSVPNPVIPLSGVSLLIQPAEPGYRYQLSRGQSAISFNLQLNHGGGNTPFTYRFYVGDTQAASGPDPFASVTLAPGTHIIRARIEAGSGNNLQTQEVSQSVVVEAAPKSDWIPFEVRVRTIARIGDYIFISGEYVSGPLTGKGYLYRAPVTALDKGETRIYDFVLSEVAPLGNYLVAATTSGLLMSEDNGMTWPATLMGGRIYDVFVQAPRWNPRPYGVFYSTDRVTYCGLWTPVEPHQFRRNTIISGWGPRTSKFVSARMGDEDEYIVLGAGEQGLYSRQTRMAEFYGGGQLQGSVSGYARDIIIFGPASAEVLAAMKTDAANPNYGLDLGDNVFHSNYYGHSWSWKKVRGIAPGDDVTAFAWISGVAGPVAITRKGTLYQAPSDRREWRVIPGFAELLGLDLSSGQTATCMLVVEQDVHIGTERGLRVLPANQIAALAKVSSKPVAVSGEEERASAALSLSNYPNPFNPVTSISFRIPEAQPVTLRIYDLRGALVEELVNDTLPAGIHTVRWVGTRYASGVYFCVLQTDKERRIQKLMLLK